MGSWTRCDRLALVRGRRLLGAYFRRRCCSRDCPQALEGVWGCAGRPRPLDGCVRLQAPSHFLGAPRLKLARRRAEFAFAHCTNDTQKCPAWLARAKASHKSIKPLLLSLVCGDRSVFDGPASRRRPLSGALGCPRTARRTFQIQTRTRRLRLPKAGRIAVRARPQIVF